VGPSLFFLFRVLPVWTNLFVYLFIYLFRVRSFFSQSLPLPSSGEGVVAVVVELEATGGGGWQLLLRVCGKNSKAQNSREGDAGVWWVVRLRVYHKDRFWLAGRRLSGCGFEDDRGRTLCIRPQPFSQPASQPEPRRVSSSSSSSSSSHSHLTSLPAVAHHHCTGRRIPPLAPFLAHTRAHTPPASPDPPPLLSSPLLASPRARRRAKESPARCARETQIRWEPGMQLDWPR